MREGNEQDAESACKSLRWDGRSGYANVGKRCWVGASGAHQSVVHKWCRPRIPHPSSRCVYIKCIIFCSYTYIIYAYFNLRMRRKSVVGCRSSHHRELPSVRPPVMTGAGSSSQMPSLTQAAARLLAQDDMSILSYGTASRASRKHPAKNAFDSVLLYSFSVPAPT